MFVYTEGFTATIKNDSLRLETRLNGTTTVWPHPYQPGTLLLFENRGHDLVVFEKKGNTARRVQKIRLASPPALAVQPFSLKGEAGFCFVDPNRTLTVFLFNKENRLFEFSRSVLYTDYLYHSPPWLGLWLAAEPGKSSFQKSLDHFLQQRGQKYLHHQARRPGEKIVFDDRQPNFYIPEAGWYEYGEYDSSGIRFPTVAVQSQDLLIRFAKNPYYPYLTASTANKPFRVFPYIKKYPRLYNNQSSGSIFSLTQDGNGRLWAGSYNRSLSVVDSNRVQEIKNQPFKFMNAGVYYKDHLYLVAEGIEEGGVVRFKGNGQYQRLAENHRTGFYLFLSQKQQRLFFCPYGSGLWYCSLKDLDHLPVRWKVVDSTVGLRLMSIVTVSEDTLGRLWCGHPRRGIAVYDPHKNQAQSYNLVKNESPIGITSSLTDSRGTVWLGSNYKGLWYYKDYSRAPTPENLQKLDHPLLNHAPIISAMAVFKNWLVLSCHDKICLVNLDSFHLQQKAVVRYLNPQEAAFTSFTEQNTMLVSHKDSSLWFSTSDMLYQMNIRQWLQLPVYKVGVTVLLQHDTASNTLQADKPLHLAAGINSFDIELRYLSPDGLPRYTRTALVRKGDSVQFSEPAVQRDFHYKNLSSGHYTFYVEVFEQEGTISHYQYPLKITAYFWQRWWFWVLACFVVLLPVLLWLNTLRRQALLQKRIGSLNIATLSNQFRPHFILNTLNTIGADLKDKPAAETIISRLGESINLIFAHSRQKKVTHALLHEWQLVINVIEIHKVMYLPLLQVLLPDEQFLKQNANRLMPMGILEIVVENALLHGLRNKKTGPYLLSIEAYQQGGNQVFVISDNGVGREKASQLSNYRKHGTGTKNMAEILAILNRFNPQKIEISYEDLADGGTKVIITLPQNYHYEY